LAGRGDPLIHQRRHDAQSLDYPDKEPDADDAEEAAQQKAAEAAPEELAVGGEGGAGIVVASGTRNRAKSEKTGPWLPFVRFDTSAVPKAFFTEDHLYIQHVRSGNYFTSEGEAVTAAGDAFDDNCVFLLEIEGKDPGTPILDGMSVLLRHYASGNYLTAEDDFGDLKLEAKRPRGEKNERQLFDINKRSRPAELEHDDILFLESWLSNFIEVDTGSEARTLKARRWKQGKQQQLVVRKKRVLEAQTTELARQMQFQSFDLDGNSVVGKTEMGFLVQQVNAEADLDGIMVKVDPEQVGGAVLDTFAAWADGGEDLSEEQLQHAEALGNIAQRCRDCLNEEDCLIEVLATISGKQVPEVCKEYQRLTGQDLKERIVQKTSEQDGYIFSNYWKLAMRQLLADPVELWCQALQDAMDGLGTDEDTLTALVCTIPDEFRADIHHMYKERKGTSLLAHIESETSFNYKKVLLMQATDPIFARAEALHRAMHGAGTDEQQLIRIVTDSDYGERKQIMEVYEKHYNKSLVHHIDTEISGDFKKAMHAIFTSDLTEYDLEADVEALDEAMRGWGTDEEALIKLLCSKTTNQMNDIRARFHEKKGRLLEEWVKSETSGYFQGVLLSLIRPPADQLAHAVRYCIQGFGTDDTGLITLVVHLPEYKRMALIKRYHEIFKRDVLKDIANDTSGDYKRALLACVKPAPQVWADALKGAMKGLGTADGLLINFLVLAKEHMDEVRAEFQAANKKPLWKWIDGDCSGDYKKTLIALAQRNAEDNVDMKPVYWAQRCADALEDVSTLKSLLANLPALVLQRGSNVYSAVYQSSLAAGIKTKCEEGRGFSFFSDYWKMTMLRLLELPISVRAMALNDAMKGFGTDEFTLTALICTLPENTHKDVQKAYEEKFGRKLVDHIESETSFNYKKLLKYATLSKIESRCTALHGAMAGWGTDEKQLIRVITFATKKERELIRQKYSEMFGKGLIEHIESETSGLFKACMVALLESSQPQEAPDYEADCDALIDAMEGRGDDQDAIVRVLAEKTPDQVERLAEAFAGKAGVGLAEKLDDEASNWFDGIFSNNDFRETLRYLMRPPAERLAYAVRYCIEGFGTDDTGLITCCVHLPERQRAELVETYARVFERDVLEDIANDTSGDYKEALLACVRPPVHTYCKALRSSMKGLGTADELLINWMCIAKDRMDEVRAEFEAIYEGETLDAWIDGDCSGDYKDTLLRVARRPCLKFPGVEAAVTAQAPPTRGEAIVRFNKTFNDLCRKKKGNPGDDLFIPEEAQQEMGCAFMYWGARSSVAPNLDIAGLWDMTNALGFPPADDGPDLRATFREWDYSGSEEIEWNDFVKEMFTRVNDPGHYEADPLPEVAS